MAVYLHIGVLSLTDRRGGKPGEHRAFGMEVYEMDAQAAISFPSKKEMPGWVTWCFERDGSSDWAVLELQRPMAESDAELFGELES